MHIQTYFDVAQRRYLEDVSRGERNYNIQQNLPKTAKFSIRAKLAHSLVALAGRLQPGLSTAVQQPIQPATA